MASPLDTLALTIGNALAGVFHSATLSRYVAGTITDPSDPPAPTLVNYSCRALISNYAKNLIASGTVEATDRQVLILASSLSVDPASGDRITMNAGPFSGKTLTIVPFEVDPAKACWDCKGSPG